MENLARLDTLDDKIIRLVLGRVLEDADRAKNIGGKGFHFFGPFWLVVIRNPHPYNNSIVRDANTSRAS